MALSEDFLLELKERNPIEDVVSSYINIKKGGRNPKGLCPFHNEKTPSFTLYPENGKVKTVLQMLSIIFYFFGMAIAANVSWDATVMVVGASVVLCWLVAAVTAISGIKYLWDNRSFINTAK